MIEVLCPTRMRPEYAMRMADSAFETARGKILFTFGIDSDDPCLDRYRELVDERMKIFVSEPSHGAVAISNKMIAASKADMLLLVNDDCMFRSKGWDEIMAAMMPADGVGVVTPDCRTFNKNHIDVALVGKRWFDILGWYNYPGISHYYADPIVERIAVGIGRLFYADSVVIDHLHYERHANGIPCDEVYEKNLESVDKDRMVYQGCDMVIECAIKKLLMEIK